MSEPHGIKSPSESPPTIQEKLSARQAKREAKAAERRERSEALKEEGNTFFRKGAYQTAVDRYQQAIAVHGRSVKPILLTNLALAYHNLGKHHEAHEAADKALDGDPKSVKARYRRAMARKNMDMWRAAAIDFRIVLKLDPRHQEVKKEIAYVEKCRRENWLLDQEDTSADSDHELPAPDDEPNSTESLSESSDCEHTGNGKPCKSYNHTECTKGRACRFSHAPDNESERDGLGRNVCRYYLMGVCNFGEKCNYSHSKEFLLKKGWWSTAEGIGKTKNIYNVQQKFKNAFIEYEKNNASLNPDPRPTQKKFSKGKEKRSWPRSSENATQSEDQSAPAKSGKTSRSPTLNKYPTNSYASMEDCVISEDEDEEYGILGFTSSEVEELWCHGIKPWDNDAREFLAALHDNYKEFDAF